MAIWQGKCIFKANACIITQLERSFQHRPRCCIHAVQEPGTLYIPTIQAMNNSLNLCQCSSRFRFFRLDQDAHTTLGDIEMKEKLCILNSPDACFYANTAVKQQCT